MTNRKGKGWVMLPLSRPLPHEAGWPHNMAAIAMPTQRRSKARQAALGQVQSNTSEHWTVQLLFPTAPVPIPSRHTLLRSAVYTWNNTGGDGGSNYRTGHGRGVYITNGMNLFHKRRLLNNMSWIQTATDISTTFFQFHHSRKYKIHYRYCNSATYSQIIFSDRRFTQMGR